MTQLSYSYFHRGGEPSLLGETIPERFRAIAERFPERDAVVSRSQGRRLSYAELAMEVDRLACGLIGMGFGKGEGIGVWSPNNLEWLLLQLATACMGAVLVNINPAYRPKELAFALERSKVNGLFVTPVFRHSDYIAMLVELMPELVTQDWRSLQTRALPQLRRVVLYDPSDAQRTPRPCPGFAVWADVLAAAADCPPARLEEATAKLDRDDPINIQFTSGTTGFPKAVVLTHHNILNNAWFSALALGFTETDRLCIPVPFYHCFGMVLANLLCVSVGACAVIACAHFDAAQVLEAVEAERCTGLHGVPTMFIAELNHPERADRDLTSLRTGIMAGAPCPPTLMRRVMAELHCPEILIGYGETEASPLTHLTARDDTLEHRTQTVGRNLPHQEVKVVDLVDGRTLPLGEIGEVCFRGYHLMRGYYGDPEPTARAIDPQGWLHSGDLGTMDADGYLRITGRLKELIIRGGENIYPPEIEEQIFAYPRVAQVAVFGVPDDYYGEEIMAWVKPRPGETLTEEEVREFCTGRLAHFKIPHYIWIVDELPMTVTGKLQKFRMREIALEKMGKAYSSRPGPR